MLARFLTIPFSVRLAMSLWLVLILGVSLRVVISKPTSGTVVPIYLNAGQRWAAEQDLYAPEPGLDVYRNPPGFAALFAPFTDMHPKLVGLAWRWLGLVVFLTGLRSAQRSLFPEWSITQQGWLFASAVLLVLPAFNNGQVNLLLTVVLLQSIAALGRGQFWLAALWLSVGIWLKLYPVAVALLACLVFPWTLPVRLVLCTLIAFIVPAFFTNSMYYWEQYSNFWHYLGLDDRSLAELRRAPLNWTILTRSWIDVGVPSVVSKLLSGIVACVCAFLVWRSTSRDQLNITLLKVLLYGTLWMTAFGPATEANTYSLWAGVAGMGLLLRLTWWNGIGYVLMCLTVLRGMFPNDWQFQVLGPQPIAAICLAVSPLAGASTLATTVTILAARVSLGRSRSNTIPVREQSQTTAR
jgi:hypothetical protein